MFRKSPRQRSKSLLKELWQLQKDDVPMTAATLLEVRHQIRNSRKCITVEITTPKPQTNELDENAFAIGEEAFPNFIWCQLLDQKLIESHNFQDTIVLPAALSVISLAYCTASTAVDSHIYPTTFNWHCSRTHRSHLIFAFVSFRMKSRVYTVEEMLNLKNASSPSVLAAVAFRDSELGQSPFPRTSWSWHIS